MTHRTDTSTNFHCGPETVDELLRRHEPALRRAARRYLGRVLRSTRDSQEILQSVATDLLGLVRVGRHLPNGPDLIALVQVMLKRKVARYWEKAKRLRTQSLAAGPESREREVTDPGAVNPAAAAEWADAERRLLNHLTDPTDRLILSLTAQEFTALEIGRAAGLTPVAVRVRLMRLRRELRSKVGHALFSPDRAFSCNT